MKCAFTMAEILLSLTIIGVVAAITLPSLVGNINERTWNTQRKALYARMSQAIALMPSLNGYANITYDEDGSAIADGAAENFVTSGLAKVMKINNICDKNHIKDCGFNSKINTFDGYEKTLPLTIRDLNEVFYATVTGRWSYSVINTDAVAFETQNGESIVVYYNPLCKEMILEELGAGDGYHLQGQMCANFVYDLNGLKGPNTVGKDIGFMSALNPTDSKMAMVMFAGIGLEDSREQRVIGDVCRAFDPDSRPPNLDEAAVIMYNKNLIYKNFSGTAYWTLINAGANTAYYVSPFSGATHRTSKTSPWQLKLYCIKR